MNQLVLELPETLHHQLEALARNEGVSLGQYTPEVMQGLQNRMAKQQPSA